MLRRVVGRVQHQQLADESGKRRQPDDGKRDEEEQRSDDGRLADGIVGNECVEGIAAPFRDEIEDEKEGAATR